MLEEKLARVKKLMEQREKIDAELAGMLGMSTAPKRGRPRKGQESAGEKMSGESHSHSIGWSTSESTGTGSLGE